eukprot:GHVS01007491.1.p1 GENE.GHVS01007491.1~~GHVS01007491.1.p1  ORF type:complete len:439 (-),score=82.19 GHVS01007491.1:422-1738(-)
MDTTNLLKISKLYGLARTFIPLLRDDGAHRVKGFFGKIAVVGGSLEYTGAPYFAAITALRMGYDISHVFCTMNASAAIKSYSPELIVHPILFSGSENQQVVGSLDESASAIISWLPRVNVVVIGPGLSRDVGTLAVAEKIIAHARSIDMPLVLDADALVLVETNPDLIKGYTRCVLTPNHHEFGRMLETISSVYGSHVSVSHGAAEEVIDDASASSSSSSCSSTNEPNNDGTTATATTEAATAADKVEGNKEAAAAAAASITTSCSTPPLTNNHNGVGGPRRGVGVGVGVGGGGGGVVGGGSCLVHSDQLRRVKEAEHLAQLLRNVCVVLKGEEDIITNGLVTACCNARGSPKRSGGQGDVLSGSIAALLGWFEKSRKRQVDDGLVPNLKHATESFESYITSYRLMHLAPHGWWRENVNDGGAADTIESKQMVAAAFW